MTTWRLTGEIAYRRIMMHIEPERDPVVLTVLEQRTIRGQYQERWRDARPGDLPKLDIRIRHELNYS